MENIKEDWEKKMESMTLNEKSIYLQGYRDGMIASRKIFIPETIKTEDKELEEKDESECGNAASHNNGDNSGCLECGVIRHFV